MVGVCRVNCPLGREKGCRRPPTVFGGGGGLGGRLMCLIQYKK
jgi:hypothetical protein